MFLILASLARAADVDLGAGLRSISNPYYSAHYGIHPFGRVLLSQHVGVEAGAYVRLPGDDVSNLTKTLVAIAWSGDPSTSFQQPIDREGGAVEVLAVLSPWKRPHEDKVSAWVAGNVGVSGMLISHGAASINPAFADGSNMENAALETRAGKSTVGIGPALGATFEMSFADRIGVRMSALQRYYLAKEPDYGNLDESGEPVARKTMLYSPAAVTLDLMVHL